MATGRERQPDLVIAGMPFMAFRPNGLAEWSTDAVPKIAGDALQTAEEQREYRYWGTGFGHQRYAVPGGYDYAVSMDTRRPGEVTMGPLVTSFAALGAITGFFRIGTAFYALATRYCQQIDLDDDACETPNDAGAGKDFGAGAACSDATLFDGSIRVWFSSATDAWSFTGSVWSQATTQNIQGTYGAVFWSDLAASNVLARLVYNTKTVRWLASGATFDSTSWATAYNIGETSQIVTGMVGAERMPWFAKKDGLYYIDQGGRSPNVLAGTTLDDNNGVGLDIDPEGNLWYTGRQLLRYDPRTGLVLNRTPGQGLSHDSAIYGRVTCHRQYRNWHYVWVYNGTDSYLMAGQDTPEEGFVWHGSLAKVASAAVTCMEVCTATSPPRLYWGAGSTVYYIRLEEPMRYAASGSLYMPADSLGVSGTRWSLAGFVVDNEGCSSSNYIDIYAKLDGGGWQQVGRVSSRGLAYVPIPTGDWRCSAFAYRLDFTNASSTSSPRIFGLTARATRRPPVRDLISTVLHCSERAQSHYGIPSRKTGAEQLAHLQSLMGQGPVDATDYWTGRARTQRVIVMRVNERLVAEKGWEEAAAAANVAMVCQSSETVSTETGARAIYGQAVYGQSQYS